MTSKYQITRYPARRLHWDETTLQLQQNFASRQFHASQLSPRVDIAVDTGTGKLAIKIDVTQLVLVVLCFPTTSGFTLTSVAFSNALPRLYPAKETPSPSRNDGVGRAVAPNMCEPSLTPKSSYPIQSRRRRTSARISKTIADLPCLYGNGTIENSQRPGSVTSTANLPVCLLQLRESEPSPKH